MANFFLEKPPQDQLSDKDGMITSAWLNWFNKIYYMLSTSNHQSITAACAVNEDARYVALTTTTATYAITLAAPSKPGIYKIIEMIARGGAFNVTMSLANCIGGTASTTCTWNTVRGSLVLVSKNDKWEILDQSSVTLV